MRRSFREIELGAEILDIGTIYSMISYILIYEVFVHLVWLNVNSMI